MSTDHMIALARPVRHEANNLLAAILGTADIMRRAATGEREIVRAERVRDAALRLEELLRAYLALAAPPRNGTPGAAVVATLRPLVMLVLGPGRPVEIEAEGEIPALAATPAELHAAVLDLARQAAAGVPAGGGLRVSLVPAPGGAMLTVAPTPAGAAPPPRFLPAAGA